MLYKNVGSKALDDILPPLLEGLEDEKTNSNALDGLRQILSVRSNVVLPFLVPRLLSPPITAFNVRALGSIAEVSGSALNQHLASLVPALIDAMILNKDSATLTEIREAAETIILAVAEDGMSTLFGELMKQFEDSDANVRSEAANLIASYCANTKVSIDLYATPLLQALLLRFNDESSHVQLSAWKALTAVTNALKKETLASHLTFVKNQLENLKEELGKKKQKVLPGFCLPKGLAPILPMFLNGLISGSPELREQSASGLGLLISLTSDEALKPFVIQITGMEYIF